MENKPVQIVTIKNKIPLYKGNNLAERIEIVELEETGFEIVANKELYEIGDKAVLIQPDYCLSNISLFESFIRPNGDESKSMLGKVGGQPRRIRAKKFTLSKEPNGDAVYSNGILLPLREVVSYLQNDDYTDDDLLINIYRKDLTKELKVTKYEEPEINSGSGLKANGGIKFPEGIYKTDEENINNLWNHIEHKLCYPIILVGHLKEDGSSITIGISNEIPEGFICSRNMRKKLTINKVVGRRNKTFLEKLLFWTSPDLNKYQEMENDDDFVKYGMPYLNILKANGCNNIVLRGELNGKTCRGSGNKNNPASKEENNIKIFGIDTIDNNGHSIKLPYNEFIRISNYYQLNTVKQVFLKLFNSKEEILTECNNYFKENMVEGIVVRTLDSKFSAKVMSLSYDSKK